MGLARCIKQSYVALAGRSHAYEGCDLPTVTFAVRVLGVLGVHTLILTNAAGGINTGFARGALTAARWIKGRRGWFTMEDVLGLRP